MTRTDRYILGLMAGPFFGALFGAMALLLLERMLRVITLVGESNGAIAYVFDLLGSLTPHYLGLALPAGLFIACYVAFRRLAQTSELAAFASLGRSLARLAAPAFAAAIVLTLVSCIVHSHLQPYGRYAYRTGKFLLANASIAQALEAGAFLSHGDVTLMAEAPPPGGGSGLGRVFVHERRPDGSRRTVTATGAALLETPNGDRSAIAFEKGLMVDERPNGDRADILFNGFDWPVDRAALGELRPRGGSEAELTWPELTRALINPPPDLEPHRIAAEFNGRVVRALSVLAMPLLAIPLAMMGGRARSAAPARRRRRRAAVLHTVAPVRGGSGRHRPRGRRADDVGPVRRDDAGQRGAVRARLARRRLPVGRLAARPVRLRRPRLRPRRRSRTPA